METSGRIAQFEIGLEDGKPQGLPWRAETLDLEVLSRGLAAIGHLFILHRLTFVEARQSGFLNRRNVNKNVLAARCWLDKSIPLGWIEPLDRTFRHSRRLRGIDKIKRTPGPRTHRQARRAQDTRVIAALVAQTMSRLSAKSPLIAAQNRVFAEFAAI